MTFRQFDKVTMIYLYLTLLLVGISDGGKWGPWTDFSGCSTTCGDGRNTRQRTWIPEGNEPIPDPPKTMTDIYSCYEGPCPVNGNWTRWGAWTECTKACGGGIRKRHRSCTNPKPAGNGKDCKGLNFEEEDCNEVSCPPLPPNFDTKICNVSYFKCDSGKMCIPVTQECNKIVECHDGSDEINCGSLRVKTKGRFGYSIGSNTSQNLHKTTTLYSVILGMIVLLTLMLILH